MANNYQHRYNYAAKLELRKQMNDAAGFVSERFPSVAGIVITMRYFQKSAKSPLMVRTVNIFPTSYANFKMACMTRGCNAGGFELSDVVEEMVKTQTKVTKGSLLCSGTGDTLSDDHARIEYKTVIQYRGTRDSAAPDQE
jgi:hypothetical protein